MSFLPRTPAAQRGVISLLAGLLLLASCSPAKLVEVQLPSGVVDPSVITTSAGALGLYPYAINNLSFVVGGNINSTCSPSYIIATGLLTDELRQVQGGISSSGIGFDMRIVGIPEVGNNSCSSSLYPVFNQPRVEARQAREALALYTPHAEALQGRLAGTEAYTIVLIAEAYCSGIPLSRVSFTGVATPTPGYTTDELFAAAQALFDTAIILSADSSRFVNMAKVGKARALLGRGKLAEAAQAVQGVPTDFVYALTYTTSPNINLIGNSPRGISTVDREGTNGLIWSADPRAAIVTTPSLSSAMPYSAKYSKTAGGTLDPTQTITNNPITLASGAEARLIEAEADLATGGTNWLTILNTLRATCIGTAACAPVPGLTAANLPPLTDPGSQNARLDLLIRERAMWLFLSGHRQGDLRRMAHLYHRDPETLWPTGIYSNPGFPPLIPASSLNGGVYATGTVMNPEGTTSSEAATNPLFTGCFNFDP